MKPIEFEGVTDHYGKMQDGVSPLPLRCYANGQFVSCWKLLWRERLKVLVSGMVWLDVHTHNRGMPPVYLTTDKSEVVI